MSNTSHNFPTPPDTKHFTGALEEYYKANPEDRRMFHEMTWHLQSAILRRAQEIKMCALGQCDKIHSFNPHGPDGKEFVS